MLKAVASESLSASGITIGSSVITGGTDTRVLFDDAGVVGESAGLTYLKATGKLSVGLTGSAAAWTTGGVRIVANAVSYTDTSSSGTVATAYSDVYGVTTILASSATTYTQYYGAFFKAPVASTNVTMTNKSALGADTVSIGGAAQGTTALAVTGTAAISGAVGIGGAVAGNALTVYGTMYAVSGVAVNAGTLMTSAADGGLKISNAAQSNSFTLFAPTVNATPTMQLGAADAPVAVAQIFRVQSVVAGTADVGGANWTIDGSIGTGAGVPGSIVIKTAGKGAASTVQNTLLTALTITGGTTNNTSVGMPSTVQGNGAAIATNATDGFMYIATCAGQPTGTPTTQAGSIPMVYDTTNHQFWFYDTAWKQPKTPAGAAIVTWQ